MELTEDENIQNMVNVVGIVIEILSYHTNMNGAAFHADIT